MANEERDHRGEQHRDPAEKEAGIEAFESGAKRKYIGGKPAESGADQPAGVFGDSRPDLIESDSAQFQPIDDDPRMTTTRTEEELPSLEREGAEELASRRSDDDLEIVATPVGENLDPGAELRKRNVRNKRTTDEP